MASRKVHRKTKEEKLVEVPKMEVAYLYPTHPSEELHRRALPIITKMGLGPLVKRNWRIRCESLLTAYRNFHFTKGAEEPRMGKVKVTREVVAKVFKVPKGGFKANTPITQ